MAVAGGAPHAILYELTSFARHAHSQTHGSLALDERVGISRIVNDTVHSPGSPHVGHRLWPTVAD